MKASPIGLSAILKGLTKVLAVILLIVAGAVSLAQGQQSQTPARGFSPNGSYALTDLETINTANGNMILRIPLASLPPARGGISARLFLIYNSKLWDSQVQIYADPLHPENNYTKNVLQPSPEGGWRYGYRYQLQLFNRYDVESGVSENACNGGYPSSEHYLYHWKLKMSFPDGAVREFRPAGFNESSVLNDGYFSVEPNGLATTCNGNSSVSTSGMTYYSTDGSYMRLFIGHDGNQYGGDNPWTLYLPDGTRVTGGGTTNQRVYDRNENYIEIGNVTINGQAAYGIADQLGRGIALSGSNNQDDISVSGVGGIAIHTTVKWKDVWVRKQYRATYDPLPLGTDYNETLDTSLKVLDRVTLPSQAGSLYYGFTYTASDTQPAAGTYTQGTGEMESIKLPTGAKATYNFLTQFPDWTNFLNNYPATKTLTYRPEYDGVPVSNEPCTQDEVDQHVCANEVWHYAVTSAGGSSEGVVTAPDGGETREYSLGGLSYKTIRADGTVIERNWKNSINSFVKTEFVSIPNAAGTQLVKTAVKDYNYDRNGNVTRVAEYDWVAYSNVHSSGSPVWSLAGFTPARVSTTSYYYSTPDALDTTTPNDPDTYSNATAPRLLQLVAASEVSNGSQPLARNEFVYDNDINPTKGNLTEQKTWDSSKAGHSNPLTLNNSVSVSIQYNQYGSPVLTTDAKGNQTQLVYGAVGSVINLYPTEVRSAYGTAVQRTETRQYDFNSGVVTYVTDADNAVSTSTTYDLFGRPTLIQSAIGRPEETRTVMEYSDTARRVITRSDSNALGDGKLVSIQHFDQMGRVRLARQLEDSAAQSPTDETQGIKVQMRYKYSGVNSYQLSSHPYREAYAWQAPSAKMDWTRAKADNGGRMLEARKYGGNTLPSPWGNNSNATGGVITTYDANTVTVKDQANNVRRSVSDGLGRLIRVDEPDQNNNLDAGGAPFQSTVYSYDAVDNLMTVTQGTQPQRTFAYSSLKRLTSATNPESGTVCYGLVSNGQCQPNGYDNNGNLIYKTDARGVLATYTYDALNRNTSVTYTNDPAATPTITRSYDGATNGKGRLWKTETGGSSGSRTTVNSYDTLGRPLSQSQQFFANGAWSAAFSLTANYDKAGHLFLQTYPSGHSVNYNYDAAGRLADQDAQHPAFSGNLGDGLARTYASELQYTEAGAMQQEKFATDTPLYHKQRFNERGQLWDLRVSTKSFATDAADGDRGAIVNYYSNNFVPGGTGADNNGNLLRQEIYLPGSNYFQQNFAYDSLSRLTSVAEKINGAGNETFKQSYLYDRWGNRRIDTATNQTWGAGINNRDFAVEPSTNRLYAPSDLSLAEGSRQMQYDAAGNLKKDLYSVPGVSAVTRVYDAENRLAAETQANNYLAGSYIYNADGQRVRRKVDGVETWQVYGLGGELLAEYAANASYSAPQKEYGYRNGQLLITAGPAAAGQQVNVALATNGATASASSTYGSQAPSRAINGDRSGAGYNCWTDNTSYGYNDSLEVAFAGPRTISEVDVFGLQQNPSNPGEPTAAMTSSYALTSFNLKYWTGSGWTTIPGMAVTGNDKVWRKFNFASVTTTKIMVEVTDVAGDNHTQIVEVEAYGPAPPVNVALATNGATVSASGTYPGFATANVNNGDRLGWNFNWWTDHTSDFNPDWIQVDFAGPRTINEIDVVGLQEPWSNPVEPTLELTARYALTNFQVQYWNGNDFVDVPGGSVTGNNKVWRKFTFDSLITSKIRVAATYVAGDNHTQVVELEAWTPAAGGAEINWLVTDQLGTPRMIFDKTGALDKTKRHDYLPFGEEISANTGGRTAAQGYTGDNVRQKFTSKERDVETGLDYFLARYYFAISGRFTSVDPIQLTAERLTDPQQINLFAYARNNPLKFIDPNGEEIIYGEGGTDAQRAAVKDAVDRLRKESKTADAAFAIFDKEPGKGPNLTINIVEDKEFLKNNDNNEKRLATTAVDGGDELVTSGNAKVNIRSSKVDVGREKKDRKDKKETLTEGILSHEVVGHAKDIGTDVHAYDKNFERDTNLEYQDKENEKAADRASNVVGQERITNGFVRKDGLKDGVRFKPKSKP